LDIIFSDISQPDAGSDRASALVYVVTSETLPGTLEQAVKDAARAAAFEPKPGKLFETFVSRDGQMTRLVLIGAKAKERAAATWESAGAALAARYQSSGVKTLVLDAGASDLKPHELASLLTGFVLRNWRHDQYRTRLKDEQKVSLAKIVVHGAANGSQAAWDEAAALVEGVKFTRELVAEPANVIYPESFVARCRERLEGTGVEIEVLDEARMRELGMGALLGVSQGSEREGRLLVIRWNGGKQGEKPTVFVGKGVTFDSGGISIKPGAGMEDMKWDMGGAGAVAGAMLALSGRKAKANVVGVCGLVENMPDGKALRPSDILTTMSGQTVEVLNTDAEGRLVLCDALTWVQRNLDPARIVDLATLTGAMIISLGHEYAGLFSNNEELAEALTNAGRESGDKLWRFPLSPAYDKLIDSPIADMKNVGPRYAGSITAAQFLQRFVENGTPWAHLDVAGLVWADKPGATWDKGATGFGVRLIDRFVRDTCEG
jgi:leucyl aminopeptidase